MNKVAFGLTGGIASGKSTVSKTFARMGVPIVDADEIARLIVRPGMPALVELAKAFGPSIITPGGELDRAKLGSMVFGDDALRSKLDQTIGPYLRAACHLSVRIKWDEGHDLVCFDAPLLIEKHLYELYRPVVVVYCSVTTQIKRMRDRNGFNENEAMARINAQASMAQRVWHADFMISTDNTMDETRVLAEETLEKVRAWTRRMNYRVPRLPLTW